MKVDGVGLQKVQLDAGSPTGSEPQPAARLMESQCHCQCFCFPAAKKGMQAPQEKMGQTQTGAPSTTGLDSSFPRVLPQRLVFL